MFRPLDFLWKSALDSSEISYEKMGLMTRSEETPNFNFKWSTSFKIEINEIKGVGICLD